VVEEGQVREPPASGLTMSHAFGLHIEALKYSDEGNGQVRESNDYADPARGWGLFVYEQSNSKGQ
jgi:hypothetical protein